jgi:hypothetical protein
MELLERYLQAVRFFLPQKQQDDIVRELSENLIAQMEDREEELGRPLTETEQADILRAHGHPMIVAGRYRPRQHLIGPVFFPVYVFALQVGLGVALLVTAVIAAVTGALEGDLLGHAGKGVLAFPGRALMVFGWTTLGFAALDMAQAQLRISGNWDPRALPKVVRHEHRIPRMRTLCDLLFELMCLVWLLLVPQAPFLLLGPAAAFVDPAPILRLGYLPIVVLTIATAVLNGVNFVRPYWTPGKSVARAAIHLASFIVFAGLFGAGEWFVASQAAAASTGVHVTGVIDIINASCAIGLLFTAIVSLVELLRELGRLNARRRASAPADSAHAPGTR